MRSAFTLLALVLFTPPLASAVIIAALFGVRDGPGSVYDWAPRLWGRAILRAAGVKLILHNEERATRNEPRIFVSNHVSWFDVFTLVAVLRRCKFVGKAELFRIPLFGKAARSAGMIAIERDNRKAAFESYRVASERIGAGASVVVYPEGTRGATYRLRPFKKGPFVLAVAAGVPIVPTILHGTLEVFPRTTKWRIRAGTVHVRFLEEIPTTGTTYDDRDELAACCWQRMADALEREHGIASGDDLAPSAAAGVPDAFARPA
ncbi:MAG: 1-acyl-sn-glycerol-3-phosphate acyltransferase [Gemmatimonadaceae bacterium]|nr:1-acyl-sn-glycerol-3-phosphate acyltransferase [Gemmatimonadaceae bacterium]